MTRRASSNYTAFQSIAINAALFAYAKITGCFREPRIYAKPAWMTMESPARDRASPAGWRTRLDLAVAVLALGALGFFGTISGTLVPVVRQAFGLNLSAAMSVSWIALVGVGLSSIPLALVMERIGLARMAVAALAVSCAGCIAVVAAMTPRISGEPRFALLLAALLVLSFGANALQMSINPLVIALGPARFAASRITLAQGVNSLCTLIAIIMSSTFILAKIDGAAAAAREPLMTGIAHAYLAGALFTGAVLVLAAKAFRFGTTVPAPPAAAPRNSLVSVFSNRWALGGALAIAAYVGAEGTIFSMLTSFLNQPRILGLSQEVAGFYFAAIYCGGLIAGRFAGGFLMRKWQPARLLLCAAVAAALACMIAIRGSGIMAGGAVLLTGPLNAIMFPAVFSITLDRSSAPASAVSGLLVMATSGGTAGLALAGWIGDRWGIGMVFAVPLCAYLVVAGFAARASQAS